MASTTAIARIEKIAAEPVARIIDLRNRWDQLRDVANIVSPVASVDSIMAMHKVSLRMVTIDHTVDSYGGGAEVYKGKFCEKDERALGKVGLDKIQAAAGVQVIESIRTDDRQAPLFWEYRVTLGIQDLDGTWRQATATRAIDLRHGSAEAAAMKEGQLAAARANGQMLAETKARLRALRSLLSLKNKYRLTDLEKPFVIPKLVPALDPSDPDQKAALIQMATTGSRALFGAPPQADTKMLEAVREQPAGTPAPPLPERAATSVEATVVADEDEDDLDIPGGVEDEAPIVVCECACGHQQALDADTARITVERCGSQRCGKCLPNARFDYALHKDVRVLSWPAFPNLKSADDVRAALAKLGEKK